MRRTSACSQDFKFEQLQCRESTLFEHLKTFERTLECPRLHPDQKLLEFTRVLTASTPQVSCLPSKLAEETKDPQQCLSAESVEKFQSFTAEDQKKHSKTPLKNVPFRSIHFFVTIIIMPIARIATTHHHQSPLSPFLWLLTVACAFSSHCWA